ASTFALKHRQCTRLGSNPNPPVFGNLLYCESSALEHATTEEGNNLIVEEMFLGVWGKLLVIAIGAAVVVLVVLIVVCFVGPGCWGYQYLHKEEEEKKKRLEFGDRQEGKKVENVDLADLSSYSKRKKSNLVYDSAQVEGKGVSFLNSFRVIFISTEDPLIPSIPLQLPNPLHSCHNQQHQYLSAS
ncbi:unnamed protein product, partial [Timema podura]|nr:unnamed protein product [Timema podura]